MEKIRETSFVKQQIKELADKTGYGVDFLFRKWEEVREGSENTVAEDYADFEGITLELDW